MQKFPSILANILTSHFYASSYESVETLGLSWLPDEYDTIRTFLISRISCKTSIIASDEESCKRWSMQCDALLRQFPSFLQFKINSATGFIDQFENLQEDQQENYCRDRAHFYRWKLKIQQHDFGQIKMVSTLLIEHALLSRLEEMAKKIENSEKEKVIFINLDELGSCFSADTREKFSSDYFKDYFVIFLTEQENKAPELASHQLSIIYYHPELISFYDTVIQAASMTKKPSYAWYMEDHHYLYSLFTNPEKNQIATLSGSLSKTHSISFLDHSEKEISLTNKSYYLERFCFFFFHIATNPRITSRFSVFHKETEKTIYLPEDASSSVQRTFDYLTRWDSMHRTCSYTLSNTEENFAVHSIFSQIRRLRDALIESCHGTSSCHLMIVDFDDTMQDSKTGAINGGLDNWISLINECQSRYCIHSIFMTARPKFYGQHDNIKIVKEAISRGDLNMVGTCFLSRSCTKAEVIDLLRAMIQHIAPQLKISLILIDDNVELELLPAQEKGIVTIQSHNLNRTPITYEEFKKVDFISHLLLHLSAKPLPTVITAENNRFFSSPPAVHPRRRLYEP